MKIIGVVTLKGGSGKTSLAVNLASALGLWGMETRVLDFDPQKSASAWGKSATGGECTKWDEARKAYRGFRLASDIIAVPEGAEALKNALDGLVGAVDRVVVDTPPNLDKPPYWVAVRADAILVPVEADLSSVRAAKESIKILQEIQERRGGLPNVLIVPSKIDKSKVTEDILSRFEALGTVTCALPESTATRDAVATGKSIFEFWYGRKFGKHICEIASQLEGIMK